MLVGLRFFRKCCLAHQYSTGTSIKSTCDRPQRYTVVVQRLAPDGPGEELRQKKLLKDVPYACRRRLSLQDEGPALARLKIYSQYLGYCVRDSAKLGLLTCSMRKGVCFYCLQKLETYMDDLFMKENINWSIAWSTWFEKSNLRTG